MDDENKISVNEDRTRISKEVKACLGITEPVLTLGGIMLLMDVHSPYIYGGKVSEDDMEIARRLLDSDVEPVLFHEGLLEALDVAFNIFDIIEDSDKGGAGRRSRIEFGSPEWMADTISMATSACPSLTLDDILWHVPYAMIVHLQLATGRRNGTITSRDDGVKDALAQLKEMRKKKNG